MPAHVKQPVIKAVQKNGNISFLVGGNSADWTDDPFALRKIKRRKCPQRRFHLKSLIPDSEETSRMSNVNTSDLRDRSTTNTK